jgi:AcrR family transcriptional regulator
MATKNIEKEEKRKIQIIQAAYDVISEKGYNNFTIEDIANQAGLSKGGVLHYFKTKEDILIHLLEQIYTLIEKNIKKRANKYKTPEKKLKAIVIAYVIIAKMHPAFYTVMVDFWAQIPVNERIKTINSKIYEKMCNEIKKVIDLGISDGVFREVGSAEAAYAINAMITNVSIQWTFNKNVYNIDHVARACMHMIMAYMKK